MNLPELWNQLYQQAGEHHRAVLEGQKPAVQKQLRRHMVDTVAKIQKEDPLRSFLRKESQTNEAIVNIIIKAHRATRASPYLRVPTGRLPSLPDFLLNKRGNRR